MHKRTARTAALLLAGTTLLAPAAAGADPVIDATTEGAPVLDGATGTIGQSFSISGSGCTSGSPGDPMYMGLFVSRTDPMESPDWHPFETATDATGSFDWSVAIPLDNDTGSFTYRWYCSNEPVDVLDAPSQAWVSPTYAIAVEEGANPQHLEVEAHGDRRGLQGEVNAGGTVTFTTDPEALPAVDEMGITGDNAAKLKEVVDARADRLARVQRMYAVFFGRQADRQGLDFWMRHIGRTWSVEEAAHRMSRSAEFRRGYGRLSDGDFLDQLYRNTLDRDADRHGHGFWGERLGRGSDRSQVALAFADSPEFSRRTEAANYVATAFLTTTGRVGSPRAMAPFVERIEDGAYKVQVIEDIALTAHSARWWNRKLG